MLAKKALVLALAGLISTTAWAATDNDTLMQELRRLADRVAQLEVVNQKLESALGLATGVQARETNTRLEDIESEVMAIRKAPKPFESLDGISAGASLIMTVQGSNAQGGSTKVTARAAF